MQKNIQKNSGDTKQPKLLLIGAGGVGKSTLLKQLCLDYDKDLDDERRREYVPIIHHNIIYSIKTLCEQSSALKIGVVNADSKYYIMGLQEHQEVMSTVVTEHVRVLWKDEGVRHTYNMRHEFPTPLLPHAAYFLDKVAETANEAYVPTNKDIVRCTTRTTGIVETRLNVVDNQYTIFDVGGQRAERKKWLHCFDEARCLIFVAGSSGFDEPLLEDPDDNRLTEDIRLFEGVCELHPNKPIILIISKVDILKSKLSRSGCRFSAYFQAYRGDNSHESVLEWVQSQFLAANKQSDREIVVHMCNLADTNEVRRTFGQMREYIAKQNGPWSGKN